MVRESFRLFLTSLSDYKKLIGIVTLVNSSLRLTKGLNKKKPFIGNT